MKLSELLRRRSALAAQSADLAQKAASISAELERVDSQLFARMKTLVDAIEGGDHEDASESDVSVPSAVPASQVGLFYAPTTTAAVKRRRAGGLEPHIIEALKAAARPISRNDLYDLMVARGVQIPGKDPRANLSAHLSYSTRIERTSEGLWQIKEEERQTPA